MPMSDLEIDRSNKLKPILQVAEEAGLLDG